MLYAADRMQSDVDLPPPHRRATVFEAADTLGISPEAVRARIKRGTLTKEKAPDGTVYVRLDNAQPRRDADGASAQSPSEAGLVEAMRDQIGTLKRELEDRKEEARRKDAIIMTMAQRIPELEPARETPPEPRGSPETASDGSGKVDDLDDRAVPWWRRLLGL
ncbi:MAG TPA: hypothetical protein VE288_13325 [Rubrobacteraceae bacterium]|jgi:hypothetical protein|nr:hypothetical protein [Rubrobacteraceae bacterium]